MNTSGAKLVVDALKQAGVQFLFGIPGTHNIELYDEILNTPAITPILVTDEQCASFMADGFARASGKLAAVNLVPGAGLTHALSGIVECFLDQVPLLVLMCGVRRDVPYGYQLHDVDQCAIVTPVVKKVFRLESLQKVTTSMLEACRLAQTPPYGPVAVEIPANFYFESAPASSQKEDDLLVPPLEKGGLEPAPENPLIRGGILRDCKGGSERLPEIDPIIEALNQAASIALYIGKGTEGCQNELLALAKKLDALVFTTLSGKGIFPENHPRWAWNTMGRAAPKAIRKLQEASDCLLAIGCRFGEVATASYGVSLPKTVIHVDIDETVLNRNFPSTFALVGDAKTFIQSVLTHSGIKERPENSARPKALAFAQQKITQPQKKSETSVTPSSLFAAIQRTCGPDTIFVTDSGNGTFLAMEHLRLTHEHSFLAPVDYSCMGYSVPAAIGAKLAEPNRPVVALVGDGAFLMTGMELITAAANHLGIFFFLLRDNELSQIAQFQKMSLGRQTCTTLSPYQAEHLAKGMRVDYLSLHNDEEIEPVLTQAIKITRNHKPVLIEVAIDYSETTYFSSGVVKTNFLRFPWKDRIRLLSRFAKRKFLT